MNKKSESKIQFLLKTLEGLRSISSTLHKGKVVEFTLKILVSVVGVRICSLWLVDDTGRQLELVGLKALKKQYLERDKFLEIKGSVGEIIMSSGKALIIDGVTKKISSLLAMKHPCFIKEEKIKSWCLMPLIAANKRMGVIGLFWKEPHKIGEDKLKLISLIASQAASSLGSVRAHEQLKLGGNIDGLTGLYTHRYFQESLANELSRARRFKYPVCLAMLDIDHFKRYNDTFGHPEGDVVLKTIAGIIKDNVRSYDTVARYGGEEITIILPYDTREKALPLAERIRKEIAMHPFKGAKQVRVTVSMGLASYPDNAFTRQEIIQRADQALYLAKEGGRNRVCSSLTRSKGLVRLAYCPPVLDTFYNFVLQGIRDVVADVGSIELSVYSPKEEIYDEQLKVLGEIDKRKIDAVALCSKVEGVMETLIRKANERGVYTFIFNLMKIPGVTSFGNVASFIGYDQVEAGKLVGKYLIKLLRGKGEIAIIGGLPGQLDSFERREGFLKALSQRPQMRVVTSRSADWQRSKARIVTRQILKEYPELDAIFAVNDEMALGAADMIKESKKKGQIFVIGLDGTQAAFEAIEEGKLTATLATNPIEMGRILMRTVLRSMIKGEKIEPKIHSPIGMVDEENVGQYLVV